MPIYEYRRPDGTTFDVMQKFSDETLTVDPDTGVPVTKVLHAPAIHFKGKGFHNTDYGTRNRNRELEKSAADGADKNDAKQADKQAEKTSDAAASAPSSSDGGSSSSSDSSSSSSASSAGSSSSGGDSGGSSSSSSSSSDGAKGSGPDKAKKPKAA